MHGVDAEDKMAGFTTQSQQHGVETLRKSGDFEMEKGDMMELGTETMKIKDDLTRDSVDEDEENENLIKENEELKANNEKLKSNNGELKAQLDALKEELEREKKEHRVTQNQITSQVVGQRNAE